MIDVDQIGLDLGATLGLLLRRFYPLAMAAAYRDAAVTLEIDLAFDLDNPLIQTILQDLADEVVDVAETTRDQIRALVGQAAAEGWSNAQLATALRDLGEVQSRQRARLIAATETAAAYSRGAIAAYEQSGVVGAVEWLTADSPCPICDPLDGTTAPLGGEFAAGIAHPPAHPNCRCALVPVLA